MKELMQPGGIVYAVDAKFPVETDAEERECLLGIIPRQLGKHNDRGLSTFIAQFFVVVANGIEEAEHVFSGLERPMYRDADKNADGSKFAYTWKSAYDAYWNGDRFTGSPRQCAAAARRVFVVIASPNRMKVEFPDIDGWIEYWNWVVESSNKPGAPIDWQTRYTNLLWSR